MDNQDLNDEHIDQLQTEKVVELDSEDSSIRETNRIPKLKPAGLDTDSVQAEAPLTDETIAIKKSLPSRDTQTPINLVDDEQDADTEVAEEPKKLGRRLKIFCYNCGQKLDLTDMESFSKVECPSCSVELIVPKWWDNYLLEESCGIGGMAKVYRGLAKPDATPPKKATGALYNFFPNC